MKYVITDEDEVAIGEDTFHKILGEGLKGRVVAAGHCDFVEEDGSVKVWGGSVGYGINCRFEDAERICEARRRGLVITKDGPKYD
jgi:hypothetical protein